MSKPTKPAKAKTIPVPFDGKGNMVSYPVIRREYREDSQGRLVCHILDPVLEPLEPFFATMRVVDLERGQSAARFTLQDIATEKRYPLFLIDMLHILTGPVASSQNEFRVYALWTPVKRGQNYGITRVDPVTA